MRIKRAKPIVVAIVAAIGFVGMSFTSTLFNARSVAKTAPVTEAIAPAAVPAHSIAPAGGVQAPDDTQVKLVTLTPRGFEPNEILVSQKRFVLAIDNRSQLDMVSVQFSQLTGNPAAPLNQLQVMQMARARVNANTQFELPPGNYVLTEANHPNWVCAVTVISK